MKEGYYVIEISKVDKAVRLSTKKTKLSEELESVAALPDSLDAKGKAYKTEVVFYPANSFGWRRFEFLGATGQIFELGLVGATKNALFLAVCPETHANVLRHINDFTVWTLREFLTGFEALDKKRKEAWPADWYEMKPDGSYDTTRPRIRFAPAAAMTVAHLGAHAEAAKEWTTAASAADAEALIAVAGK